MLREHDNKQIDMEFVCIEELVPKDHLLRKIDRVVDFDFIRDKVKDLYCADNGRPAVDPVVLFKMLFLGYLFGVRSERQLVREIQVNVAYRRFIGYGLSDKIPDASTFSQNRRRRFTESMVYQEIFDEIVLQAEEIDAHRLTREGKALYKRRKETIERSFADAKQLHGHRHIRMRGLLRTKSSACSQPLVRT